MSRKKYIAYIVSPIVIIFGLSCGATTAAYVYLTMEKNLRSWPTWALILVCVLVFMAGAWLNIKLYMRDVFPSNEDVGQNTYSIISKILGLIITVIAAASYGLFTYYSLQDLPWEKLHISNHAETIILAIIGFSAAIGTLYLFRNQNIKAIDSLKNFNLRNLNFKSCILTIIFVIGTYGLIRTMFETMLSHLGFGLTFVLIAAIVLSELIFVYQEADTFFKDTLPKLSKNKCNGRIVFICIAGFILINGTANGVLDAFTLSGNFAMPMVICGALLSMILMLNNIVPLYYKEEPAPPAAPPAAAPPAAAPPAAVSPAAAPLAAVSLAASLAAAALAAPAAVSNPHVADPASFCEKLIMRAVKVN